SPGCVTERKWSRLSSARTGATDRTSIDKRKSTQASARGSVAPASCQAALPVFRMNALLGMCTLFPADSKGTAFGRTSGLFWSAGL
ncbi:MAG TPA: hypothetical protein PKD01_12020, partial [Mesorhizobium sp.]|nr:hypothetical protein [Mesorhizobium sp.]